MKNKLDREATTKTEIKNLNVKLPAESYRRVKATAALRGEPIAVTVEKILRGEVTAYE